MLDYNEWAKKIYEQNKAVGWWDDPNRCVYQTLQFSHRKKITSNKCG